MKPPDNSEGGPRHRDRPNAADTAAKQVHPQGTTYPGVRDLDPLGLLRYAALRQGLCDFCGCQLVGYWRRFESADFTRTMHGATAEVPVHFLSFWAACMTCAHMVERREWRRLIDYVVPEYEQRTGPMGPATRAVFRTEVAATYLQLERALTGRVHTVGAVA